MHKHTLSIDLETYSPIDIKSSGAYKYSEQVQILLFAYSVDGDEVDCIDLAQGEKIPDWLLKALTDPTYLKTAWNAAFERAQINSYFGIYTPPEQWQCNMVKAAMVGLPMSLDEASKALGAVEKKDWTGKALIRYFCIPCKPTKTNGERVRNYPSDDPVRWGQFIDYCKQDVRTEQAIAKQLEWFTIPAQEKHLWCLGEIKNERGVMVDMDLIHAAMYIDSILREKLTIEAVELTGLNNVNSVAQLKKWLEIETGEKEITSLAKGPAAELMSKTESETAKRVLTIRSLMSKSSIKKYASMLAAAGRGDRLRGLIQYYGASRTGRESGKISQPQNYPRIQEWFAEIIDGVREIVKTRDIEFLEFLFSDVSDILSQLTRTTFKAAPGKELIVLDFSSIESISLAYIADEKWRIKLFIEGGDIYKASASAMFKIPVSEVGKDLRQKGKIAELACGFGGGKGAIEKMNDQIADPAKRIPKKEIKGIAPAWRQANPNIVQIWWDTGKAAIETVKTGNKTYVTKGIGFEMKKGNLMMSLPSGRYLVYQKAHIKKFWIAYIDDVSQDENGDYIIEEKFINIGEVRRGTKQEYEYLLNLRGLKDNGKEARHRETICFWGSNQTTKKWEIIDTYGPKLVENFTQAFARDCLMNAVIELEKRGFPVVLTVHDELILEVPLGQTTVEEIKQIMTTRPVWAKDLPLKAEGFNALYYQK